MGLLLNLRHCVMFSFFAFLSLKRWSRYTLLKATKIKMKEILQKNLKYEEPSISFQTFFVQALKIVVNSWKISILLLYIWDDWPIFMISKGLPWGLPEVVGTAQQVHCSRGRLLRRGLEFHVCTINKSAYMKKVWKLIEGTSYNRQCFI